MKSNMKKVVIAILFVMAFSLASGVSVSGTSTTWATYSPDNSIHVEVTLATDGSLSYKALKGSTVIVDTSRLGIYTNKAQFLTGMTFVSTSTTSWNNTYSMPGGKTSTYQDNCTQRELVFSKNGYQMKLYFRVYNDGVAYRYYLPGSGTAIVYDEYSAFNLPDGTGGWGHEWRNEYEGEYHYLSSSDLSTGSFSMPLLASINNNAYWALISEGNVYNSEGSYCASRLTGYDGSCLYLDYAPSQVDNISTTYPFETPQRFIIITDNLNDLVNSNLAYNVNPSSQIVDTSWIVPGRAAWSWWSEDYYDAIDNTFALQKKYVDFASAMGWEYVTVDAGWADWTEGSISELCSYAATKNIGIFIWANGTIYLKPEYATPDNRYYADNYYDQDTGQLVQHIQTWADWGVKGIKVDFMMDDSQTKMQTYQNIIELCAAHHLMVNFHGSTKPGGENRTWPNVISSEAVRGAEHYLNWYPAPTAYHNCTLPFTRNVVGAMDYTPCAISRSNITTTNAHQLALSVIYESGIQNFADSPDVYESWIGTEFLHEVPASWNESKLISGFPGDYVVMARRSGNDWFIGGITVNSRTVSIPLTFLGSGSYTAYIYKDGNSKDEIVKETQTVSSDTTLSVSLLNEGGCSILISRTITPNKPGDNFTHYEAEANGNTLSGGAAIYNCANCSGGYKVGYLGNNSGTLQFNNISVANAGQYELKIYYLSADTRNISCSINGGTSYIIQIPVPSGSYNTVRSITVQVNLNAGINTIKFLHSAWAPDIDQIALRKIN
jgi:alpha-glucosidase